MPTSSPSAPASSAPPSGGCATPSSAASPRAPENTTTEGQAVEIIVVDTGLAGLVAARDLRAADRQVRVLEARERPGGRTFSSYRRRRQADRFRKPARHKGLAFTSLSSFRVWVLIWENSSGSGVFNAADRGSLGVWGRSERRRSWFRRTACSMRTRCRCAPGWGCTPAAMAITVGKPTETLNESMESPATRVA